MKNVLITGSCGLIGSSLIRKIIYDKLPYNISSIDKVAYNNINAVYWNQNHKFHISDLTDQHITDIIFQCEQPEIVIHMASNDDFNSPTFIADNLQTTQALLTSSLKYGVQRFIYISDEQIYGPQTDINQSQWSNITTENLEKHPINRYAALKLASEVLIKSTLNNKHLNYNIIRSSNTYGPYQSTRKFIPKVIKSIVNKEKVIIYNRGEQLRDWLHVYDHCLGILTVLDKGKSNTIYDLSSNQEFSTLEVANEVCKIFDNYSEIEFLDNKQKNDYRYSIDNSEIKKLGWEPTHKFKNSIVKVCDWYKNNPWSLK